MWLIPGKTKLRIEIFKGVSLVDVLMGLIGASAVILVLFSTFPKKLLIAGVIFVFFVVMLIRVDGDSVYEMFLDLLRFMVCPKEYTMRIAGRKKKGKDIRNLCAFTGIDDDQIVFGSDYYGAVLEIPAVEFRLFSQTRKRNTIMNGLGNVLRSMNPLYGMNIVKIDRPIVFDTYRAREEKKVQELRRAFELGTLSEEELKARVEIVYNRIDELDDLMTDNKVVVPFYYLVFFDSDRRQLENTLSNAELTLENGEMSPKRLNNRELALFLKYTNDCGFDEKEIDELDESQYAVWAMPDRVRFNSQTVDMNEGMVTHLQKIADYPTMANDAWLATVMTMPATKVVVKCTTMDLSRAIRDIDKAIFELRSQLNATAVESKVIELSTHMDSLSSLLQTLQGENESLLKTNVYVTSYDLAATEKLGRKEAYDRSELTKITNLKRTVRRVYAENNLKLSGSAFRMFEYYVGSQVSAFDPFQKEGRSIPANSLAACYPWVFARVADPTGIKLGSVENVPVFVDFFRRDSERVNSNMVIVGKSGSGKSYATKTVLANLAADDAKIFVLDPENEYSELAENLHGKFINVGNAQYGRLNPFHIMTTLDDEDEDAVSSTDSYPTHLQFLEEFFRQIMPDCDRDSLEYLNTIVDRMYLEHGITEETNLRLLTPRDYPVFDDLYDSILREFQQADNEYIRSMLRTLMNYVAKFASGGRNSTIWNGTSTVTTDENFTVFNFQSLLSNRNAAISNAQMLLVLKYVDNEIIKNREYNRRYRMNRKIVVVIDEAHVFIDTKYPVALDFMFQLAKRIRKYNGMQIVITQNIKDFVGSEDIARKSGAIINASQYSLIFSLAPNDLSDLCTLYEKAGGINEIEQEAITMAPRGQAFSVISPMQRSTFQVEAPDTVQGMFREGGYQSRYFSGEEGSELWEAFIGESRAILEQNIGEHLLEEEWEADNSSGGSFVSFEEISEEEGKQLMEARKALATLVRKELGDSGTDPEGSVWSTRTAENRSSDYSKPEPSASQDLLLQILQSLSSENISMKVREQVNAVLGQNGIASPAGFDFSKSSVPVPSVQTPAADTDLFADYPDEEEKESGESTEDIFSDIFSEPFPEAQEDSVAESNEDEDEDLLSIMSLLAEEAEAMDAVSSIEQMDMYGETVLEITMEDLQKYVINRKAIHS